ncbi:hypothetical protein EC957_004959 [Mortierella hygrophila]|uniref:Uncharacterized protein n=1 Tax=Mortierella hygrophila TaxID=979708 RepID=A0A9P6F1F7_9FUNG|nr:hypothetical protein EC957_004959 [Mortierella hygrophila]
MSVNFGGIYSHRLYSLCEDDDLGEARQFLNMAEKHSIESCRSTNLPHHVSNREGPCSESEAQHLYRH